MFKLVSVGLLLAALAGCSTSGAGPGGLTGDGSALRLLPASMNLTCSSCSTMWSSGPMGRVG